jgi:hypothetical protein
MFPFWSLLTENLFCLEEKYFGIRINEWSDGQQQI